MTEANTEHHSNNNWLVFFFVCFIIIMAIGAFAIFTYNANPPAEAPAGGGHGMLLPTELKNSFPIA